MADSKRNGTVTLYDIRQWLQDEFPEMIWEDEDNTTFGRYIVSRRPGVDNTNGHFYVGVSTTHCWVSGNPGWATLSRPLPSKADSHAFAEIADDVRGLQTRYANEAKWNPPHAVVKMPAKEEEDESSTCVVQ